MVRAAEQLSWTRGPFDRLIIAQAAIHDAKLVTRDTTLHEHYPDCIWQAAITDWIEREERLHEAGRRGRRAGHNAPHNV